MNCDDLIREEFKRREEEEAGRLFLAKVLRTCVWVALIGHVVICAVAVFLKGT